MKYFLAILLSIITINSASALSAGRYLISGHVIREPRVVVIHEENQSATNIAIAAVGIGIMALIVGIKASENNPGQIQIVRF